MIDGKLAWGLLGTAHINGAVIPPIRAAERSILLSAASREAGRAAAYCKTWGIPRSHGSYEDLLADRDIDVVYISLPNVLHAEWSIKAVEAGKHVLCEKPIALTTAEVDAIAAAAKRHSRVVAEAFMYRHHPQTKLVRELMSTGVVGRLQSMRGSFTFKIKSEINIRLKAETGGGSVWDVGCYPLSYARLVAGSEPLEVYGEAVMGKGGVDEVFFGQLWFPGEVRAQIDSSFRSPLRSRFEISGTDGSIIVEAPFKPETKDHVILQREDRTATLEVPPFDLYSGEIADMEACVLDGAAQCVSLADSRGNVAALFALVESAKTGRPVSLG
jgi:predicted dehydrogenase